MRTGKGRGTRYSAVDLAKAAAALSETGVTTAQMGEALKGVADLATATGTRVGELLFDLNANAHPTLVLVTHDRELAARCGRMLRMEAGRLVP